MLETHLPQVDAPLREGVLVRGVHRPVRLLLGSDYAAQCNVLGHKRASATQPVCHARARGFRVWRRPYLTMPMAPSKTLTPAGTCERQRNFPIGWLLKALQRLWASPAQPSTTALWSEARYLPSTRGKLYRFHGIARKE